MTGGALEWLYREQYGSMLATLIRLSGDFALAEDVLQEAFVAAVEQWAQDGVPQNPKAWVISTARHKAIDRIRRKSRFEAPLEGNEPQINPEEIDESSLPDDLLRLIFTCCHPALSMEAQVALALRTICGLTTEEIARAFLVPVPTMAQRLVRAQQKIRDAGIPYRVPPDQLLGERIDGVLACIYLVFTEGYSASSGDQLIRRELCVEAIRLCRILAEGMPTGAVLGLLALMLIHDSRRHARLTSDGEIVLLEDQDRSLWDHAQIKEGREFVELSLQRGGSRSPYALQAAIADLHCEDTVDWPQVVALYELLLKIQPSPVVELNCAVANAFRDGFEVGLRMMESLAERLKGYYLLPAARADLLRRLDRWEQASLEYRKALRLVTTIPEQKYLERRLAEVAKMSQTTVK